MAAPQVLARNAEAPVDLRAGGEADLVIMLFEFLQPEVRAEADVAEKPKPRLGRRLVVDTGDVFDLLMVRRHPGAHQPERRRQLVEHINFDGEVLLLEQMTGGIKPGRPRPHDGDTERVLGGSYVWHKGVRGLCM